MESLIIASLLFLARSLAGRRPSGRRRPLRSCGGKEGAEEAAEEVAVGAALCAMAYEKSKYKKDVTGTEMPNAYLPADVESCWGDFWEKEGLMGADAQVRSQQWRQFRHT